MNRVTKYFIGALLAVFLFGRAEAAELVVVASTQPGLSPGQIVDTATPLSIEAGAEVTIVARDGSWIRLKGPYQGRSEIGAVEGDAGLVNALSKLFDPVHVARTAPGAFRNPGQGSKDEPWVVDISHVGDQCVLEGKPAVLWRPRSGRASTLSLQRTTGGSIVETTWPAGEDRLPWPTTVLLENRAAYTVRLDQRRSPTTIVIHIVPAYLNSDVRRAVWMGERGCIEQAHALLAAL